MCKDRFTLTDKTRFLSVEGLRHLHIDKNAMQPLANHNYPQLTCNSDRIITVVVSVCVYCSDV